MPCYHPLTAWRSPSGEILLAKEEAAVTRDLRLPCGGCLGCRLSRAAEWMLRCTLELQQHRSAVFTTLTYNDEHLPPTLDRRALQLWLKRLRHQAARPIRFFASGEYGEQNKRPHYHAIVYALDVDDAPLVERTWNKGYCKTVTATPATIAYVAGYNSKAIGWKKTATEERVDPTTGEVYQWQPPFQEMSRRPGIGGHARQWPQSWRSYAVHNGHTMPVPRFLHESWKQQATEEEIEQLQIEKIKKAILRDTTQPRRQAAEKIAQAKHAQAGQKRGL